MKDYIIIAVIITALYTGVYLTRRSCRKSGGCCSSKAYIEKKKLDNVTGKMTVTIGGMSCDSCAAKIVRYINEIDGASAKVDLKKNEAVVSLSRDVSPEEITEKVEKAGYTVISVFLLQK